MSSLQPRQTFVNQHKNNIKETQGSFVWFFFVRLFFGFFNLLFFLGGGGCFLDGGGVVLINNTVPIIYVSAFFYPS